MREKKVVRKDEREKRVKWEEAGKEEISIEGKNIRDKTKMRMRLEKVSWQKRNKRLK